MLTKEKIVSAITAKVFASVHYEVDGELDGVDEAASAILAEMDEPLGQLAIRHGYSTRIGSDGIGYFISLRRGHNTRKQSRGSTYAQAEQSAREYLLKLPDQNKGE